MNQTDPASPTAGSPHVSIGVPSPWIVRFSRLIPPDARVLDHACGSGRHARWLSGQGFRVEATDRDPVALAGLAGLENVTTREVDLEQGQWPYVVGAFDAVVVSNYLFRPRFDLVLEAVAPGGLLIYETFMVGNERYGKPSSPGFLLKPGELLDRVSGWQLVAFEQGVVETPKRAAIQRICAIKGVAPEARLP